MAEPEPAPGGIGAFDELTEEHLRAAGSLKWARYGTAIGAWVAEMDLGTAPAVTQALHEAGEGAGFIASVLGAIAVLAIYRAVVGRRAVAATPRAY